MIHESCSQFYLLWLFRNIFIRNIGAPIRRVTKNVCTNTIYYRQSPAHQVISSLTKIIMSVECLHVLPISLLKMHWICFSPTQKDKVINYRNCLSAKCKIPRESFDGLAKKEKKWRKEESQNKGKLREWNMKSLFMKDFLFVIWNISWKGCSHFKSKEMLQNKYICKLHLKLKE